MPDDGPSVYHCPRCLRTIGNGFPGSVCWCRRVTWTRMRPGHPDRHARGRHAAAMRLECPSCRKLGLALWEIGHAR